MNIPKDLLKEAVHLSGASSQTIAVVLGLQELIKKKRLERLAALQGSDAIEMSPAAIKKMRSQ